MAYYGISNNVLYIAGTSTAQATTSFTPPTTVSSSGWPWTSSITSVTSVIIQNALTVSNTAYMFYKGTSISSIEGLSYLDTSNATSMLRMFYNCRQLSNLDVSSFDTSNVTNMSGMFYRCPFISIDLSNFDTSSVTDMSSMFAVCASLVSLDLSNFDTSNVTDMSSMFYACSALTSLDLSNFDTSNVITMLSMFDSCSSIEVLDLSHFDTSKVYEMYTMFYNCTNLKTLYLNNFITDSVEDFSEMFLDCSSLTTIYCKNTWTGESASASSSMFNNCTSLKGKIVYDSSKVDKTYASPAGYFTVPPKRFESGIVNNLLPRAIDTEGNLYGGVGSNGIDYTGRGYKYGYYLSSSNGGETSFWDDVYITGYMPCQLSDIVYLKNCVWDINHTNKGYYRVAYYDSNFNYIGVMASAGMVGATGGVVDANNILLQFTVKAVNGAQLTSNVAYFRICTQYLGPDSIITVNNPINIVDDNYSVLSCFGSTGTQYINTGFNPNQNTRLIMDASAIILSKESAIFGARHGYANTSFDTFIKSTGFQDDYASSAVSVTYSPTQSTRLTMDKNKNVFSVNETAIRTATATTFQCNYPIYLFSINNAGNSMAGNYPTYGTLYSCQIYDSNTIVRDYVPVKTSANVIGLYDKANGVLYTNAGTGSFTAGSATGETIGLKVDSFKVNQEGEYVKLGNSVPLSWHSFNTVDSYVIERSINEGDYEVVYTGTPYTSTGYSTNDSPDETGIVQYRAKVVKGDLSSEYVYSNPYIVYAVSTYENLIVGGVL